MIFDGYLDLDSSLYILGLIVQLGFLSVLCWTSVHLT